ncbi:Integrase core domain-containing protein [Pseudomonas cuatrocienegasensis]|uniref:Integrase core domain-containing protein n=1 Tax=Pseudomonas cuatrocienegasensis TaxID=543360 RepID=A0ABY1BA35_9PSED|nr:Integrase core domain-containing protein [Pseudomonas cuatrocienegasensis]
MAIYNKRDLRMTVEGMLYRMRTGCPWRDLPAAFGDWSRVYKRFNAWSACGKWHRIFKALVAGPDMEWAFIDGSYTKAHQHSAGAACADDEAIGESRAEAKRDITEYIVGFYNNERLHSKLGYLSPTVV